MARETDRQKAKAVKLISLASINGIQLAPEAEWNCAKPERVDEFFPPVIFGRKPVDELNRKFPETPFDPTIDVIVGVRPQKKQEQPLGGSKMIRVRFPRKTG